MNMGAKERIQAIEVEKYAAEKRKQALVVNKFFTLGPRYKSEYAQVRTQQGQLLEQLRDFGVVGMIEEIIDQKIPRLSEFDREMAEEPLPFHGQNFDRLLKNIDKWNYDFSVPEVLDDGKWNQNLRLILSRRENGMMGEGEFVTIDYSTEQEIKVRGERAVLQGKLPLDSTLRLRLVEDALVEAFTNPYLDAPKDHPREQFGFWLPRVFL